MKKLSYNEYFPEELKEVIRELNNGILGPYSEFSDLINSFTKNNDHYLVGVDFKDYLERQRDIDNLYLDKINWTRKSIITATKMSKFSADRCIEEYADKIWKVSPIIMPEPEINK